METDTKEILSMELNMGMESLMSKAMVHIIMELGLRDKNMEEGSTNFRMG